MNVGPEDGEVPTSTVETSTDCVVPAISVLATFSSQSRVRLVLEAAGAKQDSLFSLSRADANAPEERS